MLMDKYHPAKKPIFFRLVYELYKQKKKNKSLALFTMKSLLSSPNLLYPNNNAMICVTIVKFQFLLFVGSYFSPTGKFCKKVSHYFDTNFDYFLS